MTPSTSKHRFLRSSDFRDFDAHVVEIARKLGGEPTHLWVVNRPGRVLICGRLGALIAGVIYQPHMKALTHASSIRS